MRPREVVFLLLLLTVLPAASSGAGVGKIYWTDHGASDGSAGTLQRADVDGSNVEILIDGMVGESRYPIGVALDLGAGKVYWVTQGSGNMDGVVRRAALDGSNAETLVRPGGSRGIALDVPSGKMYWTRTPDILRANLDGTVVQDLVHVGGYFTDGIALDLEARKVYWTEGSNSIWRANLTGSQPEVVLSDVPAQGIELDPERGKIYFARGDVIGRVDLDGSDLEFVVTGLTGATRLALDLQNDKIYWTETGQHGIPADGKISRSDLDGSNVEILIIGLEHPRGIALDPLGEGVVVPAMSVPGLATLLVVVLVVGTVTLRRRSKVLARRAADSTVELPPTTW